MGELKPCPICKGPSHIEQIDSNIGVLTSAECADVDCDAHWNNGWFQDEEWAVGAWNRRAQMLPLFPTDDVEQLAKGGAS